MNVMELRIARLRRGIKVEELAGAIGHSVDGYYKREQGNISVTPDEAVAITKYMHLSLSEFIEIFFNGVLPFCQACRPDDDFTQSSCPVMEARKRAKITEQEAAEAIMTSTDLYRKRESGLTRFSLPECAALSRAFRLTFKEFNDVFFHSSLPFSNYSLIPSEDTLPQEASAINA